MRRREFIGLVGGAFFAWPQCLLAQERKKIQLVGVLANEAWPPLDGLRHGLRDLGYIGGRSFNIVYRFAEGQAERYPVLATELVQMPVVALVAQLFDQKSEVGALFGAAGIPGDF
jgi:putative tryptophan/tyrosine transport system substrate-binding protein